QEQLDQLKAFWQQYGNLVTWTLIIVLGAFGAWNGWNLWQRNQAEKAALLYDELDRASRTGDVERTTNIFGDMKDRYGRAVFTQQGGLLAARVAADKGRTDLARAALAWVADNATVDEYRAAARLRLAGLLLDEKKYEEALKQLELVDAGEFAALVADRRGDIQQAQGKSAEARVAYDKAWQAMAPDVEYRKVIEAKLNVLGAQPTASAASGAEATK
ncbi:MAG: tetratricopeptide repeat protein, partial [Caldimonas sp.]